MTAVSNISTDVEPHSEREVFQAILTNANTDTQVATAPHPNPAAGKITLVKVHLSNAGAAAVVVFYDKDLSSGTPTVRGSVSAPLYRFNVPANSDVIVGNQQLIRDFFQAGIVAQSTIAAMFVKVEYVKTLG